MKHWIKGLITALLLCLLPLCAVGEEMLTAYGASFDPSLEVLDLDEAKVRVREIDELKALIEQMPNLKEVRMYQSALKRAQMDELFDSYPEIFFGWTIKLGKHTIRTDMTAFSTLHGHQPKDDDPFHNSRDCSVFRYFKYMEALDLGHNYLSDLSFLAEMPQLKVLIIGANYHCNGDLTPLAALKDLEYLEIFSTKALDAAPLAGLTKLRDLNMGFNPKIKDISCLYDLPKLERFWGRELGITDEQRAEMEAAHPDCEFDWKSYPSEGTWRKHPHYDTIYQIFHENRYIPFDD